MTPTMEQTKAPAGSSSRWFAPNWSDRLLAPFTQVEPGEGAGALALGLNVFLLLAAYYLLKTVREALILTEGGAEVKAYSSAGQALVLLALIPAYSWLASRLARFRLVATVSLFFAANLGIFWWLSAEGLKVGIAFYIWLGVFSVMVVAQFWAFANDLYTEEQGKRLFPIVGIGSSLGALVGSKVANQSFAALGADGIILLSGTLLLASVGITYWLNSRACAVCEVQKARSDSPLGSNGAFELVVSDKYLRLIAVLVVLVNVVNTGGEFLLSKLVVAEATQAAAGAANPALAKQAFIGEFYGNYFAWVGLVGLILQAFLVSRLFRWVGVQGALFLLPLIALGGNTTLLILPALAVAFTAKVAENATDYSVENTAKHALFLQVDREAKYKAKTAIDTFFYRAGDLAQAGVVWLGTTYAFTHQQFAAVNVGFVSVWLVTVVAIARSGKAKPSEPSAS